MRDVQRRRFWQVLAGLAAAAVVCWAPAPAAGQPPTDPVEALRADLMLPGVFTVGPVSLKAREQLLAKRVAALKTLVDLSRALALQDWKDTAGVSPALEEVDRKARREVGKRLLEAVRAAAQKGDAVQRLALAHYLGELGVRVSGLETGDRSGFGRALAPELVALCQDKDARVRAAAARALGKVNPEPAPAVAALRGVLKQDDAESRRAAADGLVNLVQTAFHLLRGQGGHIRVNSEDLVAVAREAVLAAGDGLKDKDAGVRRRCLEAVQQAAAALTELAPQPSRDVEFPGEGPFSDQESENLKDLARRLAAERELLLPAAEALRGQVAALGKAVADDDAVTGRAACQALEAVALARTRLLRMAGRIPQLVKDDKVGFSEADWPAAELRAVVPALAGRLAAKDVETQLPALYALEAFGPLAAGAGGPLLKALDSADEYVRWGAVRALGRMAPLKDDAALVGKVTLGLGKRAVVDNQGDVRVTALLALQRYGAAAAPAAPALAEAVNRGPADERVLAARTVTAIGPGARAAIPALTRALAAPEARVRAAAARALGGFGPAAADAVKALTQGLGDANAEVREAMAEALLLVGQAKQ